CSCPGMSIPGISSNTCTCEGDMIFISEDKNCIPARNNNPPKCTAGRIHHEILGKCILECGVNFEYSNFYDECIPKCDNASEYNRQLRTCVEKCSANEEFDYIKLRCRKACAE